MGSQEERGLSGGVWFVAVWGVGYSELVKLAGCQAMRIEGRIGSSIGSKYWYTVALVP